MIKSKLLGILESRKRKRIDVDKERMQFFATHSAAMYESGEVNKKRKLNSVLKEMNIKDWKLDKDLTNKHERVYVNEATKEVMTVYRGTDKNDLSNDLMTDTTIVFGFENLSSRFKKANAKFEETFLKYEDYTHILTGHSMGGSIAKYVGTKNKELVNEVHMFNPGSGFGSLLNKGEYNEKIHGHYTAGDPISVLGIDGDHNVHVYKKKDELNAHTIENFYSE
jgi:hypothetical protein